MGDEQNLPATATRTALAAPRPAGRKIVIVGGGSQGVGDPDTPPGNGQAIEMLAAREGASVAVVDVVADAAQETVRLIEGSGGTAVSVLADVADAGACERLVDEAAEV